MLIRKGIKAAIEAILFAGGDSVSLDDIAGALGITAEDTRVVLDELILEYNKEEHGIQIVQSAAGYAMCTKPAHYQYIKELIRPPEKRLSQAALETLAIIAYRQPVTRADIEAIRGVKSERIINSLLDRGLIAEAGRKEAPGKPVLYVTTADFLKLFGLTSLDDLPKENRRLEYGRREITGRADNDQGPAG